MVPMSEEELADYQNYGSCADTILLLNRGDLRGLYILRADGEKVPLVNLYVHNNWEFHMEGGRVIYNHPGVQQDFDYKNSLNLVRANYLLEDLAPGDSLHVLMHPANMMFGVVFEKTSEDTVVLYGYKLDQEEYLSGLDDYNSDSEYCDNPLCNCHDRY